MPPDPNQTLHEVVAALQGDRERLDSLLGRYHARLVAIAIATGAWRSADDVAQEALVKILLAIREGRVAIAGVDQFRAWAHSVARNTALDHLRNERRQMRHVDSVLGGDGSRAPGDGVQGRESTPSMHARQEEELAAIRRGDEAREERIAALRRPDQILVWMRERDGMTFGRIAVELGQATGTTLTEDAMRIRYGRLVRDRIGPRPGDGPDAGG